VGARGRASFSNGADGPFAYLAGGFTLSHRDFASCSRSILLRDLAVVERWGRKKVFVQVGGCAERKWGKCGVAFAMATSLKTREEGIKGAVAIIPILS
jgi:hypothetical protein